MWLSKDDAKASDTAELISLARRIVAPDDDAPCAWCPNPADVLVDGRGKLVKSYCTECSGKKLSISGQFIEYPPEAVLHRVPDDPDAPTIRKVEDDGESQTWRLARDHPHSDGEWLDATNDQHSTGTVPLGKYTQECLERVVGE